MVIDIARIKSTEEQAFIIGDVMKSIDEVYSESRPNRPEHLIILIDELNRYVPNRSTISAVAEQIIEIARTGRSRGTVLFGAQQFKSAVHVQVNENAGTHAIGRTGSSELTATQYRFLDADTKNNITRLGRGELVLAHPVFRQPIKVVFPKPAYRRQESRSTNDESSPRANFMGTR
jgi:DNA helicase HerA-like ATPase